MDVEMGGGGDPVAAKTSESPSQPPETAAPSAPNQASFRRQRASRACETCHARKVRCDAASLGVPCTNCVAFSVECKIPVPKRKKAQSSTAVHGKDSDSDRGDAADDPGQQRPPPAAIATPLTHRNSPISFHHSVDGTPNATLTEEQAQKQEVDNGTYARLVLKPKFSRAPITEPGRVAYLGESSNLTLLVHDNDGATDVVHYPLPDNVKGSKAGETELDNVELDILHRRGAFLLPPRPLCDELIESFFQWIHPIIPIINRTRFMRSYKDSKNPPSLLLLQAMLLAGSRVCTNPQLMDATGSTTPAALTFYKRAKALYDANYEDDRITIVQALILMGWYWEGPEDVTKNVFYWSRVATIVAHGSGMHRSVEDSQLSRSDKRLWKRVWWTLFTRDRSVAVALGRPVHINLDDSDVEMLTAEDFIEDEPDQKSDYPPDPIHVQFFLQYVKLCEIMGLVLSQQYSVKGRRHDAIDLTHSDMALADWLQNCPKSVYWDATKHHFWAALLHSNYYTTLCLLHRAHMPHGSQQARFPDDSVYPSRNIAFQAAAMITSIMENLAAHSELRYCPAFVVYSLFSALIMHVYQLRSPVPTIQQVTQERLRSCMTALKEVSKVWLVGKMVYALFESILGNRGLEDRLHKASNSKGARSRAAQNLAKLEQQQQQQNRQQQQQAQQQMHLQQQQQQDPQQAAKRKYEDMAIDFTVNTPTPQESYERSRPQTPSLARADGTTGPMGPPISPPSGRQTGIPGDIFAAGGGGSSSRPHTREPTPFNPAAFTGSLPTTPPDLYLVTRNSPNLSQSLWENFQPDQLFPEGSIFAPHVLAQQQQQHQQQQQAGGASPGSATVDPSLVAQMHIGPGGAGSYARAGSGSGAAMLAPGGLTAGVPGLTQQQAGQATGGGANSFWGQPHFDVLMADGHSPSDSWSTGSQGQQAAVPSTLNVEEWLQFFGINGDAGALNFDGVPMG